MSSVGMLQQPQDCPAVREGRKSRFRRTRTVSETNRYDAHSVLCLLPVPSVYAKNLAHGSFEVIAWA